MPLTPGARMPRAFAVTGRLLLDPMFWMRRLLDLFQPGMLPFAVGAGIGLLAMRTDSYGGMASLAALAWCAVPLLAHCWGPPVAREAAAALDIEVAPEAGRSLGTYCWWWLVVTFPLALLYGLGSALPTVVRWFPWYFQAVALLAAWLAGGFCIRAALAGVVSRERLYETFASIGTAPRVMWTLVLVALAVAIEFLVPALGGAWSIGMVMTTGVCGTLLMTTLWAAWSVQFVTPERMSSVTALMTRPHLQQHRAAPAAVQARSFPWLLVLVGAVLAGGALAWMNRLVLLDQYLQMRHPRAYQSSPGADAPVHRRLHAAEVHFACQGDVDQLRLLERVGFAREHPLQLRDALHCAARHGRTDAVRYLLARGAPADKSRDPAIRERRYLPQTPLQWAVHGRHPAIVEALLAAKVDPNQRTAAPTALVLAAHAGDWALYKRLRAAGARPDAVPDLPVVFAWADSRMDRGWRAAAEWRAGLAAAEAAGVPIAARDDQGRNLLHWAANRAQVGLMQALLERGFAAGEPDAHGAAPYAHLLLALSPQSTETPELRTAVAQLLAGQDIARPVAGSGAFARNQVTGWLAFPQGWSAESALIATPWLHALVVAGPPKPDAPEPTGVPAPGAAGTVLPVSAGPRR